MKFKLGQRVLNEGKTSRYRGQEGVVTLIRESKYNGPYARSEYSIRVQYKKGSESHPCQILRILDVDHLPEDLFTI